MQNVKPKNSRHVSLLIGAGFLIFMGVVVLSSFNSLPALIAGYAVGFLAIGLHYVMSAFSMRWENETFFALYTPLFLIRLLVVLGIYIGVIIWGKFDQFSFTVSFLISYIYHSVINIFLLNKRTNKPTG